MRGSCTTTPAVPESVDPLYHQSCALASLGLDQVLHADFSAVNLLLSDEGRYFDIDFPHSWTASGCATGGGTGTSLFPQQQRQQQEQHQRRV